MNSISFSFWSGSRSSVNNTRRNVFQRASNAANEAATPTLSSSVNSKSLAEMDVSDEYHHGIAVPAAREPLETLDNMLTTLANRQADVKRSENVKHS